MTLRYISERALLQEWLTSMLSGFFGSLALLLSAIGLYGLMVYTVEQRRREIGIHVALGGDRLRVMREIVRDGLSITLSGIVVGLAFAMATVQLVRLLLFGVTPNHPLDRGRRTRLARRRCRHRLCVTRRASRAHRSDDRAARRITTCFGVLGFKALFRVSSFCVRPLHPDLSLKKLSGERSTTLRSSAWMPERITAAPSSRGPFGSAERATSGSSSTAERCSARLRMSQSYNLPASAGAFFALSHPCFTYADIESSPESLAISAWLRCSLRKTT